MSEALAQAELATFTPIIGDQLDVSDSSTGAPITQLKLAVAGPLPHGQPGHREPFSLIFEGPASVPLGQEIYLFRHPSISGELPLLIVPIGERNDIRHYQAIFG